MSRLRRWVVFLCLLAADIQCSSAQQQPLSAEAAPQNWNRFQQHGLVMMANVDPAPSPASSNEPGKNDGEDDDESDEKLLLLPAAQPSQRPPGAGEVPIATTFDGRNIQTNGPIPSPLPTGLGATAQLDSPPLTVPGAAATKEPMTVVSAVRDAPSKSLTDPAITVLIPGSMKMMNGGTAFNFIGSVTLVQDGGMNIIVDTPTATDLTGKMRLLKKLIEIGIMPKDIHAIVTTHGHPDHNGQNNYFAKATQYFNKFAITGSTFELNKLAMSETMNLTPNVELWATPGHTPTDVSVIVRKLPGRGTVAIVGDLIYHATDAMNSEAWEQSAWNVTAGLASRAKVICGVDHIVPGHGDTFAITPEMKTKAKCL